MISWIVLWLPETIQMIQGQGEEVPFYVLCARSSNEIINIIINIFLSAAWQALKGYNRH